MLALIADDDRDSRALVIRTLSRGFPGLTPVEITDETSFASALRGPVPDMAVTDLDLRWTDGLSVFQRLRAAFPYCAVVMFTATGTQETAVEAMKTGLDDYVVKRQDQYPRLVTSLRLALERQEQKRRLKITTDNLVAAVEEKQVLLQELYHRIHNNLQLVSALVHRTALRFKDPEVRRAFGDVTERITALSILQDELYRSGDLSKVDLAKYLERLASGVIGLAMSDRVEVEYALESVALPVARASPVALLANEALLNAAKHAFPDGGHGTVRVSLTRLGADAELVIEDDGVGFPAGQTEGRLGMHLIRRLAAQARAAVDFPSRARGVACRVRFAV